MEHATTINNYLDAFASKMKLGMNAIKEAAGIYVDAIRHYTFAQKRFEERFPDVKKDTWERLKDVGNAKLIPEAFLFRAYIAAKYRALPLRVQERIQNSSGVAIALSDGKSVTIGIAHLSDRQADIVIDEKAGRIRTVEEQENLMKMMLRPRKPRTTKAAWRVNAKRGVLEVYGKCQLTIAELERVLVELKEAAK